MSIVDSLELSPLATSCALFGGAIIGQSVVRSLKRKPSNAGPSPTESSRRADRALIRKKLTEKNIPSDVDTIIIGSGMGGLSCAAILARLNRKVLVLEQHNDVAGGGTHQFDLGGYRFDSGLHYTVPWSVPIFALTCLKGVDEVCQFELMGDKDDVVDKIYLTQPDSTAGTAAVEPFGMKLREQHMAKLYADFPGEHKALDEFMVISDKAMLFVKYFLAGRLLPPWLQKLYWKYIVPSSLVEVAGCTAKEILPRLTSNKRLIALLSSMWIDTGARPDVASFMMTAAVFRGVSMEGGCYPKLGSEEMAIELTKVIVAHGGVRKHAHALIVFVCLC
jgi:all-trans-retinol 13,14-reductase